MSLNTVACLTTLVCTAVLQASASVAFRGSLAAPHGKLKPHHIVRPDAEWQALIDKAREVHKSHTGHNHRHVVRMHDSGLLNANNNNNNNIGAMHPRQQTALALTQPKVFRTPAPAHAVVVKPATTAAEASPKIPPSSVRTMSLHTPTHGHKMHKTGHLLTSGTPPSVAWINSMNRICPTDMWDDACPATDATVTPLDVHAATRLPIDRLDNTPTTAESTPPVPRKSRADITRRFHQRRESKASPPNTTTPSEPVPAQLNTSTAASSTVTVRHNATVVNAEKHTDEAGLPTVVVYHHRDAVVTPRHRMTLTLPTASTTPRVVDVGSAWFSVSATVVIVIAVYAQRHNEALRTAKRRQSAVMEYGSGMVLGSTSSSSYESYANAAAVMMSTFRQRSAARSRRGSVVVRECSGVIPV